jgi:hypothetical protein
MENKSKIREREMIKVRYEISVPWESPVHQIDKIQCDWEKIVIGCESGALCIIILLFLLYFPHLPFEVLRLVVAFIRAFEFKSR